jgi:hypothetical protein
MPSDKKLVRSQAQKKMFVRAIAIALLLAVMFQCQNMVAFVRDHQAEYHQGLIPPVFVDDQPALSLPPWACDGNCHRSHFDPLEFHCIGCYEYAAKIRAREADLEARSKQQPPIVEPLVACAAIKHWHGSTDAFRCDEHFIDPVLAFMLRVNPVPVHPVVMLLRLVQLACVVLQGVIVMSLRKELENERAEAKRQARKREQEVYDANLAAANPEVRAEFLPSNANSLFSIQQ